MANGFRAMRWFLLGAWEFRLSMTSHAGRHIEAYDLGRELAHRLTLRGFES